MKMSVRPIADSDIPGVAILAAEVFGFAYRTMFEDTANLERYISTEFDAGRIALELKSDGVYYLVGECGDEFAGILKLAVTQVPQGIEAVSSIELAKLYVLEKFHGTGIAKQLLCSGLDLAARKGFKTVWLCVWEKNPRAQAFYRKAGFEAVGDIVIPMNGVPFRDLVMRLELAGN
ncbi:MAG TPA: N-acetyltransferase [Gammaproteobacteria bacterium]